MLSLLYVRLTIKVNVGIPESFKAGWLTTLALCVVFSYNTININKKLNLFAPRQKIELVFAKKNWKFF